MHPNAISTYGKQNLSFCKENNIPVIIYILSLQALWRVNNPLTSQLIKDSKILTNSEFMSNELKQRLSLNYFPAYIYPIVKYDSYKTNCSRDSILFINPSPQKGLDIALELAKSTPEIPYIFLEGWDVANKALFKSISI